MISPHDIAESYSKLPQDVSSQKLLSEKNIYGSSQLMNMMSLLGKTYFLKAMFLIAIQRMDLAQEM